VCFRCLHFLFYQDFKDHWQPLTTQALCLQLCAPHFFTSDPMHTKPHQAPPLLLLSGSRMAALSRSGAWLQPDSGLFLQPQSASSPWTQLVQPTTPALWCLRNPEPQDGRERAKALRCARLQSLVQKIRMQAVFKQLHGEMVKACIY
jgi:hypothetical protein